MLAGETKQDQGTPIRIEYDRLAEPVAGALGIMREDHLARRIKYEMDQRGWSQEKLAAAMADAGHPVHQSAISKIINPARDGKRRTISVDEALGFSKVFGEPLESLLLPLAAVRSQRARQLITRLTTLHNARRALAQETNRDFVELMNLFMDRDVQDGLADQMDWGESGSRADAYRALSVWTTDYSIRANIDYLRDKADTAGKGWDAHRDHAIEVTEALIWFLCQIITNELDVAEFDAYMEAHREEVRDLIPARYVVSLWERLKAGETQTQIPRMDDDLNQGITSLGRLLYMLRQDAEGKDVPLTALFSDDSEAAE
jgi:plasmid maintenance system antidote protein VapI